MPSSVINSDDGVISGTSGLKSSGGDDGVLVFQSKGTETARINTDKQIVAAAGTASLPALTTTGDVNTGIFFPAADTIAFAEGGAEAMRINSSGNVGIGTTNPVDTNGFGRVLDIQSSSGAQVLCRDSDDTTKFARLAFDGESTNLASIGAEGSGTQVAFRAGGAERMRITSGGELAIGSTGGSANALSLVGAATLCLMKNTSATDGTARTTILFRDNGDNTRGTITVSTSGTVYNTTSDYRLKENIAPMTGALATIAQLNPVTYTWKETGDVGQGFVAHELQEIFPDAVTGEKDAVEIRTIETENGPEEKEFIVPQGIDTSFLVATLTAAIQELSAKNDALEARIAALEAVPGNE